jgi:hypothetical protein
MLAILEDTKLYSETLTELQNLLLKSLVYQVSKFIIC